jgi:tetratricopeptide (TPR) repeat protein
MSSSKRKTPQIMSHPDKKQERPKKPNAARTANHGPGVWLLLLALVLATLAAYYPAWHGSMLWDDDRHITRSDLRSGEGLWRIWFDLGATQQYYPVVHSTFWVLHRFWGDNTLGYHLLNIVLHALSAFLVALILRQLAVPWAWLAAVIFALHPVHVESVAWIAELKNTLSGSFYLGAALAYLRFDKSRQRRLYALALSLFVLALLSKTVTATLPAALLVTFWWQRGRLGWRRDALPLAPFFTLGAAGGWLTAWVERTMVGAQGGGYLFTPIERCLIAGRVTWFYLGKLPWPTGLTFIYPRWQISQSAWWQYIYPLGLVALMAGLWLLRKRSRAPLAAMLFFCGSLFPAVGFFNVYPFRYSFVADHFQYLASIAIIALFSASLASLIKRWNIQTKPAEVAAILVLGGALAVPTWIQSRQYANAETLYRTTISRNPTCWMAFNNLGNVLQGRGRLEDAVTQYREALRLKPDFAEAHNNLGNALQGLGRFEEATAQYKEALGLTHNLAGTYYNLGNALLEQGRLEEAVAQYREALRQEPGSAETHCNLGVALDKLGRIEEAITHFKEAVRLKPDYATACNNLGKALQRMGRFEAALIQHREALRLKPDFAEAYNGLGSALQGLGRLDEAVTQFHQALQLNPGLATAYFNLGSALHGLGRHEEAVTQYNQGLRLAPEIAGAHFNLGQILQGLGRLDEAAAQYKEALKHDPGSAEAQNNLGVALAGLGRIEEAATHFREALRLKPDHASARANLTRALALLKKENRPVGL